MAVTVGLVASLVMWLIHANLGEAYIITLVLVIVGGVILIWPERAELRRAMRDRRRQRR